MDGSTERYFLGSIGDGFNCAVLLGRLHAVHDDRCLLEAVPVRSVLHHPQPALRVLHRHGIHIRRERQRRAQLRAQTGAYQPGRLPTHQHDVYLQLSGLHPTYAPTNYEIPFTIQNTIHNLHTSTHFY